MGLLGIPTRTNSNTSRYYKNNYTNQDAVARVIRYITRTRAYENKNDLLFYGAVGATRTGSTDDIIQQFCYVQHVNGIERRGGKRIYHEVFNLLDEEVAWLGCSLELLWKFAMECARIYYEMGFQVVFAAHWEQGEHYHIHFAVNSISFITGLKWHTSLAEIQLRGELFNRILYNHRIIKAGSVAAIYFFNGLNSINVADDNCMCKMTP